MRSLKFEMRVKPEIVPVFKIQLYLTHESLNLVLESLNLVLESLNLVYSCILNYVYTTCIQLYLTHELLNLVLEY